MRRRLLGPPSATWRQFITATTPREAALRVRLATEFQRTARAAASAVAQGLDAESGMGAGHVQRVRQLLVASYTEGMPVYAKPVQNAASTKAAKRTAFESLVQQWIRTTSAKRVTQITGTTRQQLRSIMGRAREEGLGIGATARRISSELTSIGRARAALIARTEVHSAANASQLFAAEEIARPMEKEWIAAEDERTREDHLEADGQVVALDQPFQVGGELLMHPGDADGSPEQIINCRCAQGFIMSD